ncbi:MAG: single-strand DNA-binding protein [Fusobacteriaceae bacterium]|jgi:single-strand DNA-binding protein|nr:single-strand DNA-binding protein [Fusobacteriaceae bacterium]
MSMNLVVLTGRLARDPELKYGQSGTAYCRFTLAVNRVAKDEADFIGCTAFGKTAELVGEYLRKGSMIGVQGRLQTSSYEVNGEKRYRTDVIVDRVEFLESKSSSTTTENVVNTPKSPEPVQNSYEDDDDEFPF